jgi:hypothetical protein
MINRPPRKLISPVGGDWVRSAIFLAKRTQFSKRTACKADGETELRSRAPQGNITRSHRGSEAGLTGYAGLLRHRCVQPVAGADSCGMPDRRRGTGAETSIGTDFAPTAACPDQRWKGRSGAAGRRGASSALLAVRRDCGEQPVGADPHARC